MNIKNIKKELINIALNNSYNGMALHKARIIFKDNNDYYKCLTRWMRGDENSMDYITLQQIANELKIEQGV